MNTQVGITRTSLGALSKGKSAAAEFTAGVPAHPTAVGGSKVPPPDVRHCPTGTGGSEMPPGHIWDCRTNPVLKDRSPVSCPVYTLDFRRIQNTGNRDLVERFMWDLALNTDLKLTRLRDMLKAIELFLNVNGPVAIGQMGNKAGSAFLNEMEKRKYHHLTMRTYAAIVRRFLGWCGAHDVRTKGAVFISGSLPPARYKLCKRLPDEVGLDRLLRSVFSWDSRLRLFVLLSWCTGLRKSDLCQLELGCLHVERGHHYRIKYYSQKMRGKQCSAPVPPMVAKFIEDQVAQVKKKLRSGALYLFQRAAGRAPRSTEILSGIEHQIAVRKIKDSTGKLMVFRGHDNRHLMVTRYVEAGAPFYVMQESLGDKSPDMVVRYAELQAEQVISVYERMQSLDSPNLSATVSQESVVEPPSGEARLKWLRDNSVVQSVPGGYCSFPVEMGECQHANACVMCTEYFVATSENLATLKGQLADAESVVESMSGLSGYETQMAAGRILVDRLRLLVDTLENGGKRTDGGKERTGE